MDGLVKNSMTQKAKKKAIKPIKKIDDKNLIKGLFIKLLKGFRSEGFSPKVSNTFFL